MFVNASHIKVQISPALLIAACFLQIFDFAENRYGGDILMATGWATEVLAGDFMLWANPDCVIIRKNFKHESCASHDLDIWCASIY